MRILLALTALLVVFIQPALTQSQVCLVVVAVEKIAVVNTATNGDQSSSITKFPDRDVFPTNR